MRNAYQMAGHPPPVLSCFMELPIPFQKRITRQSRAREWIENHLPPDDAPLVLHGDIQTHNLLAVNDTLDDVSPFVSSTKKS